MTKVINYTTEQEVQMQADYQAGQTVEAIASSLGKSVKSVVAKLSRLGVYKPKEAVASANRVTKASLVATIEGLYGAEVGELADLEKCSKATLEVLASKIQACVDWSDGV